MVASGVDLNVFKKTDQTGIDWQKRVLELLQPVLNELTRLTAGPREIEQLRSAIADYSEQLRVIAKGLDNITQLASHAQDESLSSRLQALKQKWESWRQEVETQLQVTTQQLKQKLDEGGHPVLERMLYRTCDISILWDVPMQ